VDAFRLSDAVDSGTTKAQPFSVVSVVDSQDVACVFVGRLDAKRIA